GGITVLPDLHEAKTNTTIDECEGVLVVTTNAQGLKVLFTIGFAKVVASDVSLETELSQLMQAKLKAYIVFQGEQGENLQVASRIIIINAYLLFTNGEVFGTKIQTTHA